MIGDKLGYAYRTDGMFLIRKNCTRCGEGFDVLAIAPVKFSVEDGLCSACIAVRHMELAAK